jgi:predicted nucleotidyltransferase
VPRTAIVVAFSTTPQMAEEIDRLAACEGCTRSALLREMVRAYRATNQEHARHVEESRVAYAPALPVAPSLPGLARVLGQRSEISKLAADAGVARLWVFGSAVRDDFEPARSDFDFLVEFRADAQRKPWFGELGDLRDGISCLLGGPVDLGEAGGLRNPYVRAAVEAEKVLIYEHP